MNIAVIGLGSMGKRRIRHIREMFPDYSIFGIDNREDRRKETSASFGITCYTSLNQIQDQLDCVLVCTSPLSHNSIIHDSLNRDCHVFTELNLIADGYEENMRLAQEKNCQLFLSSPFFYREDIRYIRKKVTGGGWSYIYHIGQYLPDWHPWENYKDFFLSDRRTNGCREIMSIELPWLTDAFGDVKEFHAVSSKMTQLNIDYNDSYMIQFIHENGSKGVLVVDIVSPIAVRKLEIYKENHYLFWDGTPESLLTFNPETKQAESVVLSEKAERLKGYSAFVVENAYRNELKAFFDTIKNHKKPEYGFEQDLKTLRLIESIGV